MSSYSNNTSRNSRVYYYYLQNEYYWPQQSWNSMVHLFQQLTLQEILMLRQQQTCLRMMQSLYVMVLGPFPYLPYQYYYFPYFCAPFLEHRHLQHPQKTSLHRQCLIPPYVLLKIGPIFFCLLYQLLKIQCLYEVIENEQSFLAWKADEIRRAGRELWLMLLFFLDQI